MLIIILWVFLQWGPNGKIQKIKLENWKIKFKISKLILRRLQFEIKCPCSWWMWAKPKSKPNRMSCHSPNLGLRHTKDQAKPKTLQEFMSSTRPHVKIQSSRHILFFKVNQFLIWPDKNLYAQLGFVLKNSFWFIF